MNVVEDVGTLVTEAAGGNRAAWAELVDLYSGLIYSIARSQRLCEADAADVSQTTWLRLLEHIDRLNDPACVGAWLATTARRESLRIIRFRQRQRPLGDDDMLVQREDLDSRPDAAVMVAERDASLKEALDKLPPRCAEMLRLLMADDAPCYKSLSERLDMPIGSIGPTRARCLHKLRTILAEIDAELVPAPAPSG